jgi:ADP-ribose pyrophosphatase
MCQRASEPARGQWEVPSGYLECGESLEQGAKRETYEETGVIVDPQQLAPYSIVSLPDIQQVAISFHITLLEEPQLRCGSECLDVAFKSEGEITREQLAWLSPAASPGRIARQLIIGSSHGGDCTHGF